jgi:hypothetical protein
MTYKRKHYIQASKVAGIRVAKIEKQQHQIIHPPRLALQTVMMVMIMMLLLLMMIMMIIAAMMIAIMMMMVV